MQLELRAHAVGAADEHGVLVLPPRAVQLEHARERAVQSEHARLTIDADHWVIDPDQGSVTTAIKDDGTGTTPPGVPPTDDTPKVTGVSSPSTTEGGDLSFKVDLSNPSTTPTILTLKLTDGSGTVGQDTGTNVQVSFNGTDFITVLKRR